jgi:predicted RNase H-like HicB family nuclease
MELPCSVSLPRNTNAIHVGQMIRWRSGKFSEVTDMKYRVALRAAEEGYSVSVPGLPGCWSQGQTEQEALENIRDAIEEYLEVAGEETGNAELREVDVTA